MTFDLFSRRSLLLGAAGLTAAGGLSACGRAEAPVDEAGRVRLRLAAGGPVNAAHGGFYQAIATGAYERRGLNVEILTGAAGADVPALLAASAVELAVGADSFAPLRLIADRAPVKAVAAFLQKDPVVLMARPNQPLEALSALRDRPILMSPADHAGFWNWLRARFELTADQARPGAPEDNLKAFLADPKAVLVGRLTAGDPAVIARETGIAPRVLIPADDGYPSYGGLVLAPNAFARDNARALRDFIAASVEGWRDYVHGDGAKGDALIRRANPDLTQRLLNAARDSLKTEAVVDGGDAALYGLGAMTPERWQAFAEQSAEAFPAAPDWREAFTAQYLPGRS
ncbi:MAG: ABC transporter substrate-binding protein [Candidatus Brevundimonas phytovorans]|nr:ABC transporter substrate-binding protein [Brevundimonas sp.]WEK57103.1 MAG: ABC transporter substrate-binding protein [Brevundimonas sp.]